MRLAQRFKRALALSVMLGLMALLFGAPLFFSGCKNRNGERTVELSLAQATAITAEGLATVGEAFSIAVQEGLATPEERDAAFRELRPILNDAQEATALLDEAVSLSKRDLDRLLAFVDKTGNVFARLTSLKKLDSKAQQRIREASLWLTRVTSGARIVLAAIQPAQRNATVAANAPKLASLKVVIKVGDLPDITPRQLLKEKDIDGAIDRLTNMGVNLVIWAIEIGRMSLEDAKNARKTAFAQLEFKLQTAGF